jgi:DNA-binding transcriptional ArsR family regulator
MRQALDIFRALADPTRLRIFALLRAMELSVGELAQVLGQSQPRVSRHVKILCDAGIADRRKEGSWVFLGLGEEARVAPLLAAIDALSASTPGDPWPGDPWEVADVARLAAVRADRAIAAERYFAGHAEEWDAIRSLHVAESEVEAAILRALTGAPVGRLVDIGTGTGRMIELLGGAAISALGIDRSPEMRHVCAAAGDQIGGYRAAPSGAALCAAAAIRGGGGGAAACAGRAAADRRFRQPRPGGTAHPRCTRPARLRRRAA